MADRPGEDSLEGLRVRLEATQRAAERLARETAESVRSDAAGGGAGGGVPPGGWEVPPAGAQATSELQSLVALIDTLRGLLPEDIQRQVTDVVRQLLLLVRALIDWWISRMDRDGPSPAVALEDIPIA